MNQLPDFYKILGVDRRATTEDIKNAYWCLAKKHHPDKVGENPADELLMKQINEAWKVLEKPESRAAYDRDFPARPEGGTAGTPDSQRTYEADLERQGKRLDKKAAEWKQRDELAVRVAPSDLALLEALFQAETSGKNGVYVVTNPEGYRKAGLPNEMWKVRVVISPDGSRNITIEKNISHWVEAEQANRKDVWVQIPETGEIEGHKIPGNYAHYVGILREVASSQVGYAKSISRPDSRATLSNYVVKRSNELRQFFSGENEKFYSFTDFNGNYMYDVNDRKTQMGREECVLALNTAHNHELDDFTIATSRWVSQLPDEEMRREMLASSGQTPKGSEGVRRAFAPLRKFFRGLKEPGGGGGPEKG